MSAVTSTQVFTSIRTVGGLLPADMLTRIGDGKDVSASKSADYHVVGVRSVKDAAERHWDYLKGAWRALRESGVAGTDPRGQAIENWLLPLFEEHGYGRLASRPAGITSDDGTKVFPVTRHWGHLPIHLVPWDQDLDKRPVAGGLPPQSMVQECLNRTQAHLWAVVSNGRVLRFLRDSTALTGSAYVEVDLEAMFDGELVDDFIVLYRLLHVSRFEVAEGAPVSSCPMERWRTEAIEAGTRALDQLRDGVEEAITALGTGFLKHPDNTEFRADFDKDQAKRALLRLVYRLLFWFVAEERGALHPAGADAGKKERYERYFSARRLRDQALRRSGSAHGDRWQAVRLVFNGLASEEGLSHLGLPGLGGIYDNTPTDAILSGLSLSNEYLLRAVRSLSRVYDKKTARWRRIDYRNLGAEELGAIYESLLELVPDRTAAREFILRDAAGNDRKSTGSYYTPTSLIDCLLDSTLDPILDDATKRAEVAATRADTDVSAAIAEELLNVTVCDPACGSGHFLVAAARRIAKRLASVREHNPEPTTEALQHALRDVIARCVYGVDLNPMAVELAKVSLWLEALDPGMPLSFLDAHVKHGNALIGATPALIDKGIPDAAFKAVEGDDESWARTLRLANEKQRTNQGSLFEIEDVLGYSNTELAAGLARIVAAPAGSLHEVHQQAAAYRDWAESAKRRRQLMIANAWCAAFMWHKTKDAPPAITYDVFKALKKDEHTLLSAAVAAEVERLAGEYSFFHWHLEFPDIFRVDGEGVRVDDETGWTGGFTVLLGNPPWDKVDFRDQEYFSAVEPSIAKLAGQKRRARIVEWEKEHPEEGKRYRAAKREIKAMFHFVGNSDAFPHCARGLTLKGVTKLQTDQLFAERFAELAVATGRMGCIIPTAIATAAGSQYLFGSFTGRGSVVSLYDFENRKLIFPGVEAKQKFCLLTIVGKASREPSSQFAFFLMSTADLNLPGRLFSLTAEEVALINPNTQTLPIFRSQRDSGITADIYRRIPVLWNETMRDGNPWGITFKNLFDMTDDSDLFRSREVLRGEGWRLRGNAYVRDGERMLPLYEGNMVHYFDHRWASFGDGQADESRRFSVTDKQDPSAEVMPRYWVANQGPIETRRGGRDVKVSGVSELLDDLKWERQWLCGWRDVTNATNERTAIPAFIPRAAVGNKFHLMFPAVSVKLVSALVATQSSLIFDFVSRQKISSVAMGIFIWKQLPVPTPAMLEPHLDFIVPRVLELVYTAYDMAPLARDLGDEGEPFRWDSGRRARLRAELDAFFFRLYGIDDKADVDYILETFQSETGGLKHNEIKEYGRYRTKEWVLEEYDRMAAAEAAGVPYESTLAEQPGHGPRHPARS
jgi:hypothetical protein